LLASTVAVLAFATVGCSGGDATAPGGPSGVGGAGGGYQQGGGGYQQGGGGIPQGTGAVAQGTGAVPQGTGGVQTSAGGAQQGTGGIQQGTGGVQQGTGGVDQGAGGEGTGGIDQGTGGADPGGAPPCISDPASMAAIIGDSYVTGFGSPALQPSLSAIDPSIGQYPNYAGAGCSMASGGVCTGVYGNVPDQDAAAIAAQPNLKFVIMDGGGNDILICDAAAYPGCSTACKSSGSSTQKVCTDIVDKAMSTAQQLMLDAAAAGVEDVIYFFYPHLPGTNAGYSEILDYSEPLAKDLCDNAVNLTNGQLHCYFVDLVQPFAAAGGDGNPANFAADSIHPSAAGQQIIATEITRVMSDNCLGQASGCCAP
jgi:lysophospholipase L1-like esterase